MKKHAEKQAEKHAAADLASDEKSFTLQRLNRKRVELEVATKTELVALSRSISRNRAILTIIQEGLKVNDDDDVKGISKMMEGEMNPYLEEISRCERRIARLAAALKDESEEEKTVPAIRSRRSAAAPSRPPSVVVVEDVEEEAAKTAVAPTSSPKRTRVHSSTPSNPSSPLSSPKNKDSLNELASVAMREIGTMKKAREGSETPPPSSSSQKSASEETEEEVEEVEVEDEEGSAFEFTTHAATTAPTSSPVSKPKTVPVKSPNPHTSPVTASRQPGAAERGKGNNAYKKMERKYEAIVTALKRDFKHPSLVQRFNNSQMHMPVVTYPPTLDFLNVQLVHRTGRPIKCMECKTDITDSYYCGTVGETSNACGSHRFCVQCGYYLWIRFDGICPGKLTYNCKSV